MIIYMIMMLIIYIITYIYNTYNMYYKYNYFFYTQILPSLEMNAGLSTIKMFLFWLQDYV